MKNEVKELLSNLFRLLLYFLFFVGLLIFVYAVIRRAI